MLMIIKYHVIHFADIEWKLLDINPLVYFNKFIIDIRR